MPNIPVKKAENTKGVPWSVFLVCVFFLAVAIGGWLGTAYIVIGQQLCGH